MSEGEGDSGENKEGFTWTHTLGFLRSFLSVQATVSGSVGSAADGFLF